MSPKDLYECVLASLHAAAFDDARWPAASGLIDEFCGAKGNMLVTGEGATSESIDIFFSRFCFRGQRDAALEQEYFESYHAVDERLPRIRRLPDGLLAPVGELFGEREVKSSAVYNELMPRSQTRDSVFVRMDGPAGSRIVFAVADPVGSGGWSSDRVEAIQGLLPHLRQYVRVRAALAEAGALGASMAELLGDIGAGVAQIDGHGRIVAANDRARALLRAGNRLSDAHGVLRAVVPAEDAALRRLLARALCGEPGEGGSMRLSTVTAGAPLALHVIPLRGPRREHARGRVRALLLAVDPARRSDIDPERLADLLGLTPTESVIAVLLAKGRSIDEVADELGRSRTTVKWHMRHIYAKHGLSRQMELMRLVWSLVEVLRAPP